MSNLQVRENGDALDVSVDVENTGSREGTETVQLYIQDVTASLVRPVKELKGFAKAQLAPGKKMEVHFTLPKMEMGFFDNKKSYRLEDGLFRIFVGSSSRECLCEEIKLSF